MPHDRVIGTRVIGFGVDVGGEAAVAGIEAPRARAVGDGPTQLPHTTDQDRFTVHVAAHGAVGCGDRELGSEGVGAVGVAVAASDQ